MTVFAVSIGAHLITDELGRLLVWANRPLAAVFGAGVIARGATDVALVDLTESDVADYLVTADRDETSILLVEAMTVDAEDATRWTVELVDRVPIPPAAPAASQ